MDMPIPKFNIGDEMWYMCFSDVANEIITGIIITNHSEYRGTSFYIKYLFNYDKYHEIKESKLFTTKEELINSL